MRGRGASIRQQRRTTARRGGGPHRFAVRRRQRDIRSQNTRETGRPEGQPVSKTPLRTAVKSIRRQRRPYASAARAPRVRSTPKITRAENGRTVICPDTAKPRANARRTATHQASRRLPTRGRERERHPFHLSDGRDYLFSFRMRMAASRMVVSSKVTTPPSGPCSICIPTPDLASICLPPK